MRVGWFGKVEGMMRHQNPDQGGSELRGPGGQWVELPRGNSTPFHREEVSAISADNCELIIDKHRLRITCDDLPVKLKAFRPATPQIVERQVMVPGHNDLRFGQLRQELTSTLKFLDRSMLNQIA